MGGHSVTGAISRLQAARPSLSETERTVADWLLGHPKEALNMTMAKVADACDVSDTTVLRTARAAGFTGFTELKLHLAQDLVSPAQLIHNDVRADDTAPMVVDKVFGTAIQALQHTRENIDSAAFGAALDYLNVADSIVIGAVV